MPNEITYREAADMLGIGERMVINHVNSGRLQKIAFLHKGHARAGVLRSEVRELRKQLKSEPGSNSYVRKE